MVVYSLMPNALHKIHSKKLIIVIIFGKLRVLNINVSAVAITIANTSTQSYSDDESKYMVSISTSRCVIESRNS